MATNAHKSELQLLHPASNYSLKAAKVCTDRYDSATLSSKETYFDQVLSNPFKISALTNYSAILKEHHSDGREAT